MTITLPVPKRRAETFIHEQMYTYFYGNECTPPSHGLFWHYSRKVRGCHAQRSGHDPGEADSHDEKANSTVVTIIVTRNVDHFSRIEGMKVEKC